jgi:RIO kinase 1
VKCLSKNVLNEWAKKYPSLVIVGIIKSGKEADVWKVLIREKPYALKVYNPMVQLSTKEQYIEGQWINEPSLRKAVKQKTKVGKTLQQRLWTKREYYLIKKLFEKGAIVPEVFDYTDNAILVQYLGDENGFAPRLIDIELSDSLKTQTLVEIEANIKLFLDNGIVHGDLSAYNILWWDGKPWIIDFPQSIDIRHNPNWKQFYERDVQNIKNYFV